MFERNFASVGGGAASLVGSIVRGRIGFADTQFIGNRAMRGGAIFADSVSELDFRRINIFHNNRALSGGAILVISQNRMDNQVVMYNATFTSNKAGKALCKPENNLKEDFNVEDCQEISREFDHAGPSCGAGGGGALCLLLDQLPDRSKVVVQIREVLFSSNSAVVGGAVHIRMAGDAWTDLCPLVSLPIPRVSCQTVGLIDVEFSGNTASNQSSNIFANDPASVFVARNASMLGLPSFSSLEDA